MRKFNLSLSRVRITSEHAFGRFKGRFQSLKEMGRHENLEHMYKAIEALMVIHNICIDWNDHPKDIWNYDPKEEWEGEENEEDADADEVPGVEVVRGEVDIPAHETNEWLKWAGRQKRLVLLNRLFP